MEKFYKTVKLLKEKCPLAFPCTVRRVKLKKHDGLCIKKNNSFSIKIDNSLNEKSAIDTLLHEWAHARAWNHLHDSLSQKEFELIAHDASWGVAYSQVYRIFEENFYKN